MGNFSNLGGVIEANDQDLLDHAKTFGLGHDQKMTDIIYRELNRRSVKKAADRVIVAAIITGAATVLIQILSIFAGK
jgi:hypothetical protein